MPSLISGGLNGSMKWLALSSLQVITLLNIPFKVVKGPFIILCRKSSGHKLDNKFMCGQHSWVLSPLLANGLLKKFLGGAFGGHVASSTTIDPYLLEHSPFARGPVYLILYKWH